MAGSVEKAETDMFWSGLVWVVLLGTIIALLVLTRGRTRASPAMPAKVVYEGLEVDRGVPVVADGRAESEHVRAKNSLSGLWASADVDGDMPVPDTDSFSYSKFQQALLSGVERQVDDAPVMKMHSAKDLESWNQQLTPLREILTRSNKTIEQWMEENNVALPEDVIEMWSAVKTMKSVTREDTSAFMVVNAEEAASLVKDAIQTIPNVNVDYASAIMREILHARAEATSIGVTVPPLSLDQKRVIEFWKLSGQQPAADLASKILSRS